MAVQDGRLVPAREPIPSPRPGNILIKTRYAGVNRPGACVCAGYPCLLAMAQLARGTLDDRAHSQTFYSALGLTRHRLGPVQSWA